MPVDESPSIVAQLVMSASKAVAPANILSRA